MKAWILAPLFILFSLTVPAQEQMVMRINEQGFLKLFRLALQYNSGQKGSQTLIIPQNTYKFTIPKSQINSNPIVPIVSEISDINLQRDLDFYLNTSDIQVSGAIDSKSLKTQIFNSSEKGFDLKLSLNLTQISVKGESLSLCEDKLRNSLRCGNGLKATIGDLSIATKSRPVILSIVLRLRTDGKVARVSVRSVDSNLDHKSAPALNINFNSLQIPRIAIVINGEETELDTSRLREQILNYRTFLGKKLLSFSADFIANDLAEMINVYLVNKEVATAFQLYSKNNLANFDEFLSERELGRVDNTYLRPNYYVPKAQPSLMEELTDLIQQAQVGLSLKKISTPGNKDIELSGLLDFVLNGRHIRVSNTLGNSKRILPSLNLSSHRNSDLNLAISEPLINGVLDVANSQNLFQQIMNSTAPVPGFSIRNVKLHFSGNRYMVAVMNAQVDLKKLNSKGVKQWFKNRIAAWLERNNNNSVIYFPIEVGIVPSFKRLSNGHMGLDIRVLSPFNYAELPNRFNYPSNVPEMTETVKDGVMEELRGSLEPYTNKTYSVDLSKFLNKSGVIFNPKNISIDQGAYLLLDLDIADIKFNSKNPNRR